MIMYDNAIYVDARVYGCAILEEDLRIGGQVFWYVRGYAKVNFVVSHAARGGNVARNNQVGLPLDVNGIARLNKQLK